MGTTIVSDEITQAVTRGDVIMISSSTPVTDDTSLEDTNAISTLISVSTIIDDITTEKLSMESSTSLSEEVPKETPSIVDTRNSNDTTTQKYQETTTGPSMTIMDIISPESRIIIEATTLLSSLSSD